MTQHPQIVTNQMKSQEIEIKITEVYPHSGYHLEVTFDNQESYIIDFSTILEYPAFQHLNDPENIKKFALLDGTLQWDGNADLAPEFIYELAMKQMVRV